MKYLSVRHQLLAILLACFALGLQWALQALGELSAWAFFFPAVIVSSLWVGRECGSATSLYLSILTFLAGFSQPIRLASPWSNRMSGAGQLFIALGFAVAGIVLSRWLMRARVSGPVAMQDASHVQEVQHVQDNEIIHQRAIEEAPFPIMIHAEDGTILSINRAWTELSGYSRQEIPDLDRWTALAHPENKDSVRTMIAGLYDKPPREDYTAKDVRIRCRDGSDRFWSLTSVCLGQSVNGYRVAVSMATDITQHRAVAATLSETQDILQAAMDQSPIGISVANAPDGRLRYINRAGLQIRGDAPERQVGGMLFSEYLMDKRQCRLDGTPLTTEDFPLCRVVKRGELSSLEYQIEHPDGTVRYVFANASPIRNDDQEIVAGVSIFIDVTERKLAEKEALSNARYRHALLDNFPFLVWLKDTQGRFLAVNEQFARSFGYDSVDQLVGKTDLDITSPEMASGYRADDLEVLRTGESKTVEKKLFIHGREVWMESHNSPVIVDGEIVGTVGFAMDVTERRQVLQALADSEDKSRQIASLLRLMCDNVPDMIWAKDLDKRYVFANEAYCRQILNAVDTREPYGNTDLFFAERERATHPDDPEWHTLGELCQDSDSITLERGVPSSFEEAGYVHGVYTVLEVMKAPFHDRSGQLIGIVGSARNITARKQFENELEQHRHHLEELVNSRTQDLAKAKEAAEHANRAKSTFLANMSHEIRTPLNGIVGMTHILRRSEITQDQAERLDKIDAAAEHLLSLINDVLDLSKIEAGKIMLESAPLSVLGLLGTVESILSVRALAKGIHLETRCDDFPSNLRGDATRLQQALINYGMNAIKFTDAGSVIIRAHRDGEGEDYIQIRFEVEDTGIGIAQEAIPRLFDAFEQGESDISRRYGGTGLGLAITRRLAEEMGGAVGARSTLGAGSTFWFTARLGKNECGNAPDLAPITDAGTIIRERHQGRRILVVDDDLLNREVAQFLLEDIGLAIDLAEDGQQAVDKVRNTRYAVVLMDMQMPNLDGLAATRHIRQMAGGRDLPIVAMTANAFVEDKARCLAAGMDDFVAKPFVPDVLFSTLLKHFQKRTGQGEMLPSDEQP